MRPNQMLGGNLSNETMELEIKSLSSSDIKDSPSDPFNFQVPILVEIGEKGKEGAECFYFTAASPTALSQLVPKGEFHILRGFILMEEFSWKTIRKAVANLVNHAGASKNWNEVISFFSRYGVYDSEDMQNRRPK